jgi:hypothetical protein
MKISSDDGGESAVCRCCMGGTGESSFAVAVIDFQRALTENTEGKKAADAMKEVGAAGGIHEDQKEIETIPDRPADQSRSIE